MRRKGKRIKLVIIIAKAFIFAHLQKGLTA